ncbi:MAG TPA: hypothetical protein VGL13_08950, partial [Polyangiaceae bacterium]
MIGTSGAWPHLALALWIPFSLLAFFIWRPERAAVVVILGAAMFLPERGGEGVVPSTYFRFPLIPYLDKENLPYVCVLFGLLLRAPGRLRNRPRERWFTVLVILLIIGAFGTALTNGDTLSYGKYRFHVIQGLTFFKDGGFMAFDSLLRVVLPFFIGLTLFRSAKSVRDLLAAFAVAGLLYIPFVLVEIRMSPQFHNWIYG